MTMVYRFPMCYLLVLFSTLALLRHSVEAGSAQENAWVEPHDTEWKKRVAQNQRFLTRKGRESLRNEFGVRNRQLEEEEAQQRQYNTTNSNRIRGQQQQTAQNEERRQEDRRDLRVDSTVPSLNVLVCLVQWSNHPDRNEAVSVEDYRKLFNGEGRDADLYPGGSVKEYFEAMSYGEFTINFEVTDWIMTDYTEQQFTADGSQGRTQELQTAFEPVLEWLDNSFFDFSKFDNNYDRLLDLTIFLHSGYDGSIGAKDCETEMKPGQRVASHARTGADLSTWRSSSQFELGAYAVAPAFRETCDLEIGRIGTIVHELIHPFGLPDLYDMESGYGTGNIGGIDRFGVMANPSGNAGGDLSWPGHVSAWTRVKLGWINPTVIDSDGTYELRAVEAHPDMFKITEGFADKEYLLLENRQAINGDFDEKFFSPGGILIYHVDENIWDIFDNGGTTGNSPRGGPFLDGWPGNGKHYPIALLQADGLYELEQGINGGGSTDIWNNASQVLGPGNGEKVASKANYPNTDSYAFGAIKETGITIKNFSTRLGSTMTFEVCGLSGACTDNPTPDTKPPTNAPTTSPTNAPTAMEVLVNGSCEIAADAFRPDGSPKAISNIINGNISETCFGEDREGVWYTIEAGSVPDGEVIRANTCFSETDTQNKISVFKGDGCITLECVETDEIACKNGQLGHVVYWVAEPEVDYYMFAHSVEDNVENIDVDTLGDGSLLLNVLNFPPIANDNCGSVITTLTDGSVVSGSTEGATPEANLTSFAACGIDSAGVWFKVNGTGSDLRATTCLSGTDHPTQIHVFSGSCDSLLCISVEANNYAACSDFDTATNSATVNWETEEGVEYFILVGSRDGSVGNFELSVTEFTPVPNDQCSSAVGFVIPEIQTVLIGSTQDATNDFPYGEYCGVPLDTAGVWYTVEGTGEGLSLSTCGQNDYNSAISIFTGSDCGELECLTGIATRDPSCDYDGVTAAWLSQKDETYHIYVHGSAQNAYGSFELEAEKFTTTVENGFCNEALAITDPAVYIRASTLNATHSAPTNVCGGETVNPGLWYSFEGTGYPFYVSACPSDDFHVSVSFFSGDTCGELSCVSGHTFEQDYCVSVDTANKTNADADAKADASTTNEKYVDAVRFLQELNYTSVDTEVGVTYYLFVHGQESPDSTYTMGGIGKFDLTFLSGAPQTPPPTAAPEGPGSGGGNGNSETDSDLSEDSETDSDLSEDNVSTKNKVLYSLLGVGGFLILVFVIPILWIYRHKLWSLCCPSKDGRDGDDEWDPTRPPGDLDMEVAPFRDERSSGRRQESTNLSQQEGVSNKPAKKHFWQTLSFRSS